MYCMIGCQIFSHTVRHKHADKFHMLGFQKSSYTVHYITGCQNSWFTARHASMQTILYDRVSELLVYCSLYNRVSEFLVYCTTCEHADNSYMIGFQNCSCTVHYIIGGQNFVSVWYDGMHTILTHYTPGPCAPRILSIQINTTYTPVPMRAPTDVIIV